MKRIVILLAILLIPVYVYARTVTLLWDYIQGSDTAVKYRMYRQVGCTGTFTPIGDITLPTQSFADSTVLDNTTYCYRVTALNSAGGESTPSNVVQFLVPKTLEAPTNLRGTVN